MTDLRFAVFCLFMLSAALGCSSRSDAAGDGDDHAVILLYHHVAEDTPRSTSVSPRIFESHLDFLADNGYVVVSLTEVVSALLAQTSLPPNSVAITFDDGYASILTEALPRLARRGWPFTVFVSTDSIDQGFAGFMDWQDLRRVEASGGTIANHTVTHDHLVRRRHGESATDWLRRAGADIESAGARLREELERPASKLLAWPFGEFDSELEQLAKRLGYVALGQQSGPAGHASSLQSLPRFPMATGFADIDGLAEKLETRPLPVEVVAPASRVLAAPAKPAALTLRLEAGPYRPDALRCFVAGQAPAAIEHDGDLVTVTAHEPFHPGRGKFNCTVPSTEESGVFYWYSHLWLQPSADGSWYAE